MDLEKQFNTKKTSIMGILNVTPDSFSDGGQFNTYDEAMKRIEIMINQGATIIDIGAESTRPGAKSISLKEEISRLEKVIKAYTHYFDVPLSLDTTKSEVAAFGCEHGVAMINDISGLTFDPKMVDVVAAHQCYTIVMHIQEKPTTMQQAPKYNSVVKDVTDFLKNRLETLNKKGVTKLICDPGIGFGKTVTHNLQLLNQFQQFQQLGVPLLVGTSRKSFIGQLTGEGVEDRLEGSIVSALMAVQKGANIVRVHDIAAMKRSLQVYEAIECAA